jgi:DNA-binding transcriptional LysR family regulator
MEGKGIALAWNNLVEPHLSNKWLVQFKGPQLETGNGYYLVLSKDNPIADVVQDWISELSHD